ncbi:MAG: MFS transporter, partial [Anaerolineaceae bacterium]|nr:MFS transporter [Anaerolineaceae bacterium]
MAKSNIALNNENQPPNKTIYAIVYFLSYITLGMSTAVLGPMLSQIGDSVSVSLGVVSLLLAIKATGYFIGSVGSGRIFDRFSGHKIQVIAISLMTLCMLLIPLTKSFIFIIFIMVFLGMMEGTLDVGGNTLLLWKFKSNVAPYMNGLHFFFGLGAFIAPLIVANVLHFDSSLRWTFWLVGIIFIPSIIGFAFLPSPIPSKKTEVKDKLTVKKTVIILIVILFFTYVGTELSFGSWIYTYSLKSNLTNETTSAYLTSAFWGALTIGRLLG